MMFAFFKNLTFEALSKADTSIVMPGKDGLRNNPNLLQASFCAERRNMTTTVHPIVGENKDGNVAFFLLKESEGKQVPHSFWYQPN